MRKLQILMMLCIFATTVEVFASPPAVGMASPSTSCMACHANNGPWTEDSRVVVDLFDKATKKSIRQVDGSFLINCKRGETISLMTVLGYSAGEGVAAPHRNGWIFVDTTLIGAPSVSKFAAGWEADIVYGCKIVGDRPAGFDSAAVTSAPLSVRATENAKDSDIELQFMLTSGEAVKNKPREGLIGNYFTRTVRLRVTE